MDRRGFLTMLALIPSAVIDTARHDHGIRLIFDGIPIKPIKPLAMNEELDRALWKQAIDHGRDTKNDGSQK